MDKIALAIIGIGTVGAGIYFLSRSTPAQPIPGGVGNGGTKKETATTEALTGEPTIIYNIPLPPPQFPDIPVSPLDTPWWIIDPEPPPSKKTSSTTGKRVSTARHIETKKEIVQTQTALEERIGRTPTFGERVREQGLMLPEFIK